MIALPAVSLILLQNPVTQTFLTRYISNELAATLGTNIRIDKVSVTFINRVQIKNFYIEDQQGDTLLTAEKINVIIRKLNRENREIKIKRIIISDANINFLTDSAGTINLKFIIDFLKKPDNDKTAKTPWTIQFLNIDLRNSRFHLAKEQKRDISEGINFTDMDMSNLNIALNDFKIKGDTISMLIRNLNLEEKSGFKIENFSSNLVITKNQMHFDNVYINTPYSEIVCNLTHLNFFDFKDFSDFIDLVNIDILFEPSKISFSDISYFAPSLTGYTENFRIKGHLSGKVNDIKGDKIILHYNTNTLFETNFNIIGLPEFKKTFMHFDISKLITTTEDIELLELPGKTKHISLPQYLRKLGKIHYSGKYTGYPDDFVAYGKFQTNLGDLYSDLLLKPDTLNTLRFGGRLKTIDFRIGELLSIEEKMGKISMSGNVDGFISSGSLYAEIESTIDSFEVYKYNYENIIVSGAITEKNFSGSFAVEDPNINLEFTGKADFSGENPEYDFEADVKRARPYYLNIEKSDPAYFASFLLKTNFSGNKIDDLDGEISLVNSLFQSVDQEIRINDFSLKAYNNKNGADSLIIRSDIIDGEIFGAYKFSSLPSAFDKLINYYLPSRIQKQQRTQPQANDQNDFNYNFHLKNIHPFMIFFFNKYDIGNNTSFYGNFNSDKNHLTFYGTSPYFSVNNNTLKDISITTYGTNDNYNLNITGSVLSFNNLEIENVIFNSLFYSDTAKINLNWDNLSLPRYEGNLSLYLVFDVNDSTKNNRINVLTQASSFHHNDELWNLLESKLSLEKRYYHVENFRLQNKTQDFYIHGTISEKPTDILNAKFSELDLSSLNIFTKKHKIELEGLLSGEAALSDLLNKPIFLSDLTFENFIVNNELLGKGHLIGYWNNEQKKIEILAETIYENNKQLEVKGDYYPETDKLDFNINLDKLKLNLFEPFLSELISDLHGTGSGTLNLGGSLKNPDLNGKIRLQKTSLIVNYLLTKYTFSNDVSVIHNNIQFNNFEIFDEKGSKSIAQGTIFTNNLKSLTLDLRLTANNFMFLNLTEKDNELFYGKVNASGLIRFSGPSDDMLMEINAKTDRNSVFFLPLYGTEEIYEHDFIQWTSKQDEDIDGSKPVSGGYEVKLKGLKMNFNLEVTQDVEVQLIFDPKVGDILRGRGDGNIKMVISPQGKFEIFGDIIIDRGDYLFTLKNLINKYFQVEQGGRISWDGDPLDANIDLSAVYKLKASLYSLAPEPMESLRKRIPVETQILMTGKLMNPTITPRLNLPTADQQTKNILNNRITTDEELMNQFISLLVINNFYSDINPTGLGGAAQRGSGVATSELFSNQLSRWFSQISKDFDIGLNYRIGDEITTDQLEVALSTQILDDRISISGNFGVGGQTNNPSQTMTNPNNIAGDFDIDFRLSESGKIHLKAFNHTNYNLLYNSPYTQGVGITYRENFNNFRELLIRYKDAILSLFSKERRKKIKTGYDDKNDEEEIEEKEELYENYEIDQ